jgi:hypothetical protein
MAEKRKYYNKKNLAITQPDKYMSIIMDGMSQNHCELPWFGNLKQFQATLPQHLQAVYDHGQCLTVFRTFHNIKNDSNLGVHCMLAALEARMKNSLEGKLPPTIYIQVDGGPENANKLFLAYCEYIVASGLTDEIVISRLPVGHTHEDIDAKFAKIWTAARNEHVLTPHNYRELILNAIGKNNKSKLKVVVEDLFVIPDYEDYLKDCVDNRLSRFVKLQNAQLSWQIKRCSKEMIEFFPLLVVTKYRAFVSETVREIYNDNSALTRLNACITNVDWYPLGFTRDKTNEQVPPGMYILQKIPFNKPFLPLGFISGSRAILDKTVAAFRSWASKGSTAGLNALKSWELFALIHAPKNDDVNEYTSKMNLKIPLLRNVSANIKTFVETIEATKALENAKKKKLKVCESTAYVLWNNRGDVLPKVDKPRKIIEVNKGETIEIAEKEISWKLSESIINNDYASKDKNYLVAELKSKKLKTSGNKDVLVARLNEFDEKNSKSNLNTSLEETKNETKKRKKRKSVEVESMSFEESLRCELVRVGLLSTGTVTELLARLTEHNDSY